MSLSGLRVVDDSNELPASMENWLNAGSDWTEHHGIDLCAAAPTVAEELFYAPPTSSEPVVARSPFLKLDALELCKDSSLMGSDSSSSIESNSSSHDSPGNHTRKRPFDDLYAGPVPPAAGAAMAAAVVTPAGVVSMVPPGGAGILFPGAPLTLPTVPSMEEIAQSRPKRRNVKISTDPQSVAARHRRERISDRVRVLQHFVPGGTKMDTASMLDEAIHYVKFLQQQLQKLERLGNMSDARFMNGGGAGGAAGMMMPMNNISGGAMHHPFDLNYCNTTPYPTSMIMQQSLHQQHHHQQAQNPLCSHQSFPDHEQFCH